jgi:16S rRNA (uracil1498-N3)-methyltransferase
VAAIQPLVSARTEISRTALARAQRVARWRRVAVSSCKQCGRAVVPPVHEPRAFVDWLGTPTAATRVIFVEPAATGAGADIHDLPSAAAAEVATGPEGGWTDHEWQAAERAGCRLVTLGALTLRADVVPIIGLTALRTVWRDL